MESPHQSSTPNSPTNVSVSPASTIGTRNPRLATVGRKSSSNYRPDIPIPVLAQNRGQQTSGPVSRQGSVYSQQGDHSDSSHSYPLDDQYAKEQTQHSETSSTSQPNVDVLSHSLAFLPPPPKLPSECQLLCVFYAEFDIIVGPKICFQCPDQFLDHDITMSSRDIDQCLANTFHQWTRGDNDDGHSAPQTDYKPMVATNSLSIFDSTSEYIIPGNELADRIISLSTHSFHILTRATIIYNSRYQRNSLLFSVGFVIRRAMDPSPFRSLLSKLSSTLRAMEMETQFLSDPRTRIQVDKILRGILFSLNNNECNLILDDANTLNLKLFKPPSGFVTPVPDYVVPVLLRPEWQVLSFDWDLTINWIVPWVDGIKNIRLIAQASSVDVEMVRASIQVLQYHGVVALVDQFWYSNMYECTQLASQMLAGHQPKLLNAMYEFVCKIERSNDSISYQLDPMKPTTPAGIFSMVNHHKVGSVTSKRSLGTSFDILLTAPANALSFNDCPSALSSHQDTSDDDDDDDDDVRIVRPTEYHNKDSMIKGALSLLYCSFSRDKTFGDVLLSHIVSSKCQTNEDDESKGSTNTTWKTEVFSCSSDEYDGIMITPIDWLRIFESFDHRRFVTFGIVFGLIQRVHEYPFVYDIDDQYSGPDDTLTARVAKCMDGTRSDDELSCMFEQTYTSLLALVKSSGKKDVLLCNSML